MLKYLRTGAGRTETNGKKDTSRINRHRKGRRNKMKKTRMPEGSTITAHRRAEALFTTKKKAKSVVKRGNDLRNRTKGGR